ncbi:uncharacterized protein LAJ45_05912 [Morchella importuna]|uniref:uncharacterized protein n=1 Tax=Morchella importuna TaxID=1174673 RepID=UPI001E8DAD8B|nr:uncharacterized protein LAJ45_05912 [Morchella importuna]KAH8150226.1 hypothetical protein LAJ45_05912 [Morchella importuna]
MTPHPPKVLAGILNTESERAWEDTKDRTDLILTQRFPKKTYLDAPNVVVALKHFDLGMGGKAIGVKAATDCIERDHFNTRLSVWGDGAMSSSGCAWMAYQATDKRFRSGTVRTSRRSKMPSEFPIEFETPFEGDPTVLVWISGFQMGLGATWEMKAHAIKIEKTSFTLVVEKGIQTNLHQGLFSWLAFMPGEGVAGGSVEDIKIGGGEGTAAADGSYVWTDPKEISFGKTLNGVTKDNVMVGISAIKFERAAMRLCYKHVEINDDMNGMKLTSGTWWGSVVRSATMSWVAVV